MSQYETLLFLEQTGAATVEIIETAKDGTVCCFFGADDDCEISPEDFNEWFQITDAIYE